MTLDVYTIIFFGFLVAYMAVTLWSGRKGTKLSEYYNMDGSAPVILVVGTYAATWISAVGMLGDTGVAAQYGLIPALFRWGCIPGFAITAFVGLRLRRFGQVTLGDFMGERYDSPAVRVLTSLVTIVGLLAYFLTQLIGTGVVFEAVLGIPFSVAIIMMAFVFCVIVVVGGSKSNTITDTIMMALIAVGLAFIVSPILISKVGLEAFAANAQAEPIRYTYLSTYYTPMTVIGTTALWMFGNVCNPSAITRCYLVKDDRAWLKTLMYVFMLVVAVAWFTFSAGASTYVYNPNLMNEIPSNTYALPWATKNMLGPIAGGIGMAALMAAGLSTATTQILTIGVSVARDICEKTSKRSFTEKQLLTIARVTVVVVSAVAIPVALGQGTIITLVGNFGSSVFAASFAPALILGLFWKGMTKQAAIASMLTGLISDTILHFGGVWFGSGFGTADWLPFGFSPALLAMILSLVVALVVAFSTKPTEAQLAVYKKVSTPNVNPLTSDKSLKVTMAIFATYIVVFLIVVAVFSNKVV